MAKTATDYLAAIAAVKAGYLDAKWNAGAGAYVSAAGFQLTSLNGHMLQAIAVQAGQGVATETDKTRARTVVDKLTSAPCYGGTTGQSWATTLDNNGDVSGAIDQPTAEALYYAWKHRVALGLSGAQIAAIAAILTTNRDTTQVWGGYESGRSLNINAGTGTWNNQDLSDWQLNVLVYAHLLGSDQTAQISACAKRFLDHIDETVPEHPADTLSFLLPDFGWRYIDEMPWYSWEYGAMSYGKFAIWYPDVSAAMALTAGEILQVKAWQRHIIGTWQRNGYPNWDTCWSDMRGHTMVYWLWGLKALMGMVRGSALNQGANDHLHAKWMLDAAIDSFVTTFDTYASDPDDSTCPRTPFGTTPYSTGMSATNVDNTWSKETGASKFIAYLGQAVDLGIADGSSSDPGNRWGWDWYHKAIHVSTPYYDAASLPWAPLTGVWGSDAVQLQHWGISRIATPAGQILTALGGYQREAFSLLVSRGGVTDIDTGDPAATSPTQAVTVDGVAQTRTNYDTTAIPTTFADSIRNVCARTGTNYRVEVDTEFRAERIRSTHKVTLTGAAGPAGVLMSIPARKSVVIEYVTATGTKQTVWNGSTLTARGSPAPDACRYVHMKWAAWGAGLLIVPRSATVGTGAKVTASAADPSGYPRRQPDQDRSLLIYLADTLVENVGDLEIVHDYVLTDGTDAGANSAWESLTGAGGIPNSPLKWWDGAAWRSIPVKRWDGAAWETLTLKKT